MKRIEIKSNEYKIYNTLDDIVLYSMNLGEEIACTIFCKKLSKAALARGIDAQQLKQIIKEMNPNNVVETGLLNIRLIGGQAGSTQSQEYVNHFIETLQLMDNNRDIVNIISFDVNDRLHADSFEFDCYHGGIRAL